MYHGNPSLNDLLVSHCQDIPKLFALHRKINLRQQKQQPVSLLLNQWKQLIQKSQHRVEHNQERLSNVDLNTSLPVSVMAQDIIPVIQNNSVVILAGETGSGKTTQLPKICMQAGLGARGMIGHTQPRRVAATSIAARIAEELHSELGDKVGVSVRFFEKHSPNTVLQLMTDGILLAELQRDPLLSRYEVIIIDEAHERSINIDFLLGSLKLLLKKRPDLKVIIASATIDVESFSKYFNDAPIIEVKGRSYPVEICYCPLDNEDTQNLLSEFDPIVHAIEQAMQEGAGDILVFLSGEREIHRLSQDLKKQAWHHVNVLPLYARLSIHEQQKIFRQSSGRKIVLATNVAETSITVPGIRYVIDPGVARISRFSTRSKIQRLPIEKISQASANQRAGRCGRVASGKCFRLYSEEDFLSRSAFTTPEIKRTNLASVILQMKAMNLNQLHQFPFLEPPEERDWKEGLRVLHELKAINDHHQLTQQGKVISKIPLDPQLAIMLLHASETALHEILIIVSFLSVRDPRLRPQNQQKKADQMHQQWQDKQSDFMTILNLWKGLHEHQDTLSNRLFKEYCSDNFIQFLSWLEWRNIYRQLKHLLGDLQLVFNKHPATYEQIHRALLPGLLGNVLTKTSEAHYLGARQAKVWVHPLSTNFKKSVNWIIAADIVETEKRYARITAPIESSWLEDCAGHVTKERYFESHWRKKKGEVCAYLQKSLYGLIFVANRLVRYGRIEPELSREHLIKEGLIQGNIILKEEFHTHNQQLIETCRLKEKKLRREDVMISDDILFDWFDEKLPKHIWHVKSLERWSRQYNNEVASLFLKESDILRLEEDDTETQFPSKLSISGISLQVDYHFEPGHEEDGVAVYLPASMVYQFQSKDFDWLVPGLLQQKILYTIKALPKQLRKNFIPVNDYSKACYDCLIENFGQGYFYQELAVVLEKMSGISIDMSCWKDLNLPNHLSITFKVVDKNNQLLKSSKNIETLQGILKDNNKNSNSSEYLLNTTNEKELQQKITEWTRDFNIATETIKQDKMELRHYKALQDNQEFVSVMDCHSLFEKNRIHHQGVARLMVIKNKKSVKYFMRSWQNKKKLSLLLLPRFTYEEVVDDLALCLAKSFVEDNPILVEKYDDFNKMYCDYETKFSESMNEHLMMITQVFEMYKSVQSELIDKKIQSKYIESFNDISHQLNTLFKKHFLVEKGIACLQDYKRYLTALSKRIDKIILNFPYENKHLKSILKWEQKITNLEVKEHNEAYTLAVEQLLHMFQEWRISIFAQGQKTLYPISEKRLEKQYVNISKLV